MPRGARLDFPCLLQHVIVRGIERRKVFLDDKDREDFIRRVGRRTFMIHCRMEFGE